jgi:hypothetical protein
MRLFLFNTLLSYYIDQVIDNVLIHELLRERKTGKGVKSSILAEHIHHCDYRRCFLEMEAMTVRQNLIKSKAHTLGLYHQRKTALSGFDTKRWICEDNTHTLALGHILTRSNTEDNAIGTSVSNSSAPYQYQPSVQPMIFGKTIENTRRRRLQTASPTASSFGTITTASSTSTTVTTDIQN